jgi:DeoR/GlpR family transcriptional regulator of sugar metabolism
MATASIAVAAVEIAMVRHTRGEVVVLADDSKIGLLGDAVVCPLHEIDVIPVDDGVRTGVCEEMRRAGPRCVVV